MRTASQIFFLLLGLMALYFGLVKYDLTGQSFAYTMIIITGVLYVVNILRENWFMVREWELRVKETDNYWRLVEKRPEILTTSSRKAGFETDEV